MKRALIALALGVASCGQRSPPARAQALVHIDTDAHVPRSFDRLRITVLDASFAPRCVDCAREVVLDAATPWPLSFGVPSTSGKTYVRATLYLSGRTTAGVPRADTAIDVVAELRFGDGVVEQDLFLPSDCTGIPIDPIERTTCVSREALAQPIGALPAHEARATRKGTWHGDLVAQCQGSPRADGDVLAGDTCLPGGVFWLGDHRSQGFGPAFDAVPERLVAVRPFFLDRYEYTVARYRAAVAKGFRAAEPPRTNCSSTPTEDCARCNLDAEGKADDRRPLNCVSWKTARELCKLEGKRLPTETEWEYAAAGRDEERLYPWGATWTECEGPSLGEDGSCMPNALVLVEGKYAQLEVGKPVIDRSRDGILGLAGGVTEWTADAFQPYSASCWRPGSYGPSPRCDHATIAEGRSARGTAPSLVGSNAYTAAGRLWRFESTRSSVVGFRCARDDG